MTPFAFISEVPAAAWIFTTAVIVVIGGIVLFALHRKGDVFAEFSLGHTMFKLEAKERQMKK